MDQCRQVVDGAVLLTVNQRLARFHTAQYQQWQLSQGNLWWETPNILPLRSWLKSLHYQAIALGESTHTVLPDLLQQRAWRQCIEQDTSLALLDVEAATRSARQAHEIACVWRCLPEQGEGEYLPVDQIAWRRWHARYRAILAQNNWVDESLLADHLLQLLDAGKLADLLPEALILDGFLQLPPQLQALVDTLQSLGSQITINQPEADACVHHVQYTDDADELLSIATDMRTQIATDPQQSLGLVVPDLQNTRAQVLRAFDRVFFPALSPREIIAIGRPYDLSIGQPLADTAVIRTALLVLKLCLETIEGNDIPALILSPYIEAAMSESRRREQLERRLREHRVRSLNLEQFLDKLYSGSKLADPLRKLLASRNRTRAVLSVWAKRFSDWLESLGWPGRGLESDEYQAVSSWLECLDDLQLLDDNTTVSAADALRLVQRLARERIFQLETPNTPIQIMGRLESHGIGFDCLWVAGLDAEQWPPSGSPSPFLSIVRQKAAGVPNASASARLALAQREFAQWCSQSALVIASCARVRDGKELVPAQVPSVEPAPENTLSAAERIVRLGQQSCIDPVAFIRQGMTLESLVDDHGPGLPSGSEVRGGARLFENQALCPFKAFALHRLNIRPLEEASLGLDSRQQGNLLHHALELFWRAVKTQSALFELSPEELDAQVAQVIDEAIVEMSVPEFLQDLERIRLSRLIKEWLLKCEVPRQAFEVVSFEQRQNIEHGGIVMTVMLDRIDRVDNSLVVLDYKTGTSNKISTWANKRIVNPQLPLYVLTNNDIEGASFAQAARNQCVFKGVASDASLLPKVKITVAKSRTGEATSRELEQWSDWRVHWQESLDAIAMEVREGLATVTPMKTACTFCELKSLCRINESTLESNADDEVSSEGSVTHSEQPDSFS